jgi:hypothetical protein
VRLRFDSLDDLLMPTIRAGNEHAGFGEERLVD